MSCFVVFQKDAQIRVFPYLIDSFKDRWRARQKAIDLAQSLNHHYPEPCTIEDIGFSGVGTLIQYPHNQQKDPV